MSATKGTMLFLLLCACCLAGAQSLQWQWGVRAGGLSSDRVVGIGNDAQGYLYIAGYFMSNASYGPFTLNSAGENDIFVAKMNTDGDFLWAVRAGGPYYDLCYDISVDLAGNVYVTGSYSDTALFGPHQVTTTEYCDTYIAKLDTDGNWLWVSSAGGEGLKIGLGVVADNQGNCYATGYYNHDTSFGGFYLTVNDYFDIYVTKLDTNGDFLWVDGVGGPASDVAHDIALDGSGNIYLSGTCGSGADFGGITVSTLGSFDIFVAKMNTEGTFQWAANGGAYDDGSLNDGYRLSLDAAGNIYLCGYMYGTAWFGTHTVTSQGNYDILVAKLNSSGEWLWARQAGGINIDACRSIVVEGNGNVMITGSYCGPASFGSIALGNADADYYDIFCARMDPDGNWLWVERAGDTYNDDGRGLALNGVGEAYLTGDFFSDCSFGNHSITSLGSSDIFVARLDGVTLTDDEVMPDPFATSRLHDAWPNPLRLGQKALIKTEIAPGETGILSIFNPRGQIISSQRLASGDHQINLDSRGLASGIYLYQLRTPSQSITRKLVLYK